MIRLALLALAVFFSLSACRPTTPPTDAGAVPAPSADSGSAAAVVVDPAATATPAVGPDGGSAVVMPAATVKITSTPATPATPADVKPVDKAEEKPAVVAPMAP